MTEDFRAGVGALLRARPPKRVSLPDARDAAVLIPIVADPEPTLLFTVRSEHLPSHKGQIAFPGGSIDPQDASPVEAALREAEEEIGLPRQIVAVLGELDDLPTFVSGYVVTPVVGWLSHRPELTPNPGEVTEVLWVPIARLTEEIRAEAGFTHGGRAYPTEAWIWEDRVIWGVTARILRNFLTLLATADLVDAPAPTHAWGHPPSAAEISTEWPLPEGKVS
ncbi:MAG: CoA pyrophosphatase [Actinomycetota bacterium]|nr:CoA pyrophosphatase [Actinomycetota bacterium]